MCEKSGDAAKANGYDVLIIADHGNADNAVNPDGTPNTAHSLNPVPCIWVTDQKDGACVKEFWRMWLRPYCKLWALHSRRYDGEKPD